MSVPNWYDLLLLGLASWRTYVLLAQDDILARPRRYVTTRSAWLAQMLDCPYCAGFWVALGWWGTWQAWPHGVTVAAAAAAVTAIVPLIEHLSSESTP